MLFFPRSRYRQIKGFLPSVAIAAIVACGLLAAGTFFFLRGQTIMETQLKDKLRSTAAAAAMQFSGDTIVRIKDGDTMPTSATLRETVARLEMLRQTITNIRSAYIMKRSKDPDNLTFVADADESLTPEQLDRNGNGEIDIDEIAPLAGDLYDWRDSPELGTEAFLHPTTDEDITSDQWGDTISGYAPIRKSNGEVIGILGLDMEAQEYTYLSNSIFSPVAFLLIVIASLCLVGSMLLFLWKRRLESLEKLEIERSGLLRLAFHQLGGPLTIISWSIEELQENGPHSLQRSITNIQEGVKRLTGILHTLKEADIVHSGTIDYKPELASLSSIVKNVVKDSGTELVKRHQHVTLDLADTVTMQLDPTLIAGVVQELLTNAISFSPDNAEIVVRSRSAGQKAILEIEDTGCGIPPKDMNRIFDEFTRGSNATKYKADGNGLGLYIVRGIIERAGGKISIKSAEGKGTTVRVELPIA